MFASTCSLKTMWFQHLCSILRQRCVVGEECLVQQHSGVVLLPFFVRIPLVMHFSHSQVAAVAAGQSTTTFVRGFDFYKLVYGTVNDEEDTNVDHASSSTTTTHAVSSAPHVNSRPSTAELRAATGPATDTADVKLVRMHQDCTRLANATQACRETSAALLSSGGRAGHGGAVDQGLLTEGERRSAHGLECAAQCRSWSDAVQVVLRVLK